MGLDDSASSCETVTLTGPIEGFYVAKNPGLYLTGLYFVYDDFGGCHNFEG